MRVEMESEGFGLDREEFGPAFAPLARRHGLDWRVTYTDRPKRMAIMVSRYEHCLLDLLWRWDAGELHAEIPLVISNPLEGQEAVILGRSNLVGKPMAHLLLRENATVCHSRTRKLAEVAARADILIVALGRQEMIGAEYIREGAVVVDVGIHRRDGGGLVGDVRFYTSPKTQKGLGWVLAQYSGAVFQKFAWSEQL